MFYAQRISISLSIPIQILKKMFRQFQHVIGYKISKIGWASLLSFQLLILDKCILIELPLTVFERSPKAMEKPSFPQPPTKLVFLLNILLFYTQYNIHLSL